MIKPLLTLIIVFFCATTPFVAIADVEGIEDQAVIPGKTSASPDAQKDIDRINYGAKTDFVPLVGIPFMDSNTDPDLSNYVNNLYRAAIVIAALMAVIRIIVAGFQYMLSDIVTQKTDARKSIQNALLGLLIVIGAVLILETINPNLTQINALTNLRGLVGNLESVPVGVTRCTSNTQSAYCCTESGGKFVTTSNGNRCSEGTAGIKITGDNVTDSLTCEVAGYTYDNTRPAGQKCTEKTLETTTLTQEKLDAMGSGFDINQASDSDLNTACFYYGNDFTYSRSENACVR